MQKTASAAVSRSGKMAQPPKTFTGRVRRKTSRGVRVADVVSRWLITLGGLGTILAIALVCLFLLYVVFPLFTAAEVQPAGDFEFAGALDSPPLHMEVDEYQTLGWILARDGELLIFRADTGQIIGRRPFVETGEITAFAAVTDSEEMAIGFADGSVRRGKVTFRTRFLPPSEIPSELEQLEVGQIAPFGEGMIMLTPERQFRLQEIDVALEDALTDEDASAVRLLSATDTPSGPIFAKYTDAGRLVINTVQERKNLMTGEVTRKLRSTEVPVEDFERGPPSHLILAGLGSNLYLAWPDGHLIRYATQNLNNPQLAESLDLLPDEDLRLTALDNMIGGTTLLAGDSAGNVGVWFPTRPPGATTPDSSILTPVRTLDSAEGAVLALAPSQRSRTLAVAREGGSLALYYVTTGSRLAAFTARDLDLQDPSAFMLAMSPKDDGLFALTPRGIWRWSADLAHPEASMASLFTPVWYEGYPEPEYVWQSSSGTDDFEPKLGLMPLVFGTLKATFYSMLFGVPLALLAAIYTSEFLNPKLRGRIKPTVELMAGLPSVVLGFLAALVFAPFIEKWLPEALAMIVTLPLALLAGAYLWQLIPRRKSIKWGRYRLAFIFAMIPVGLYAGILLGPIAEAVFFAGNLRLWLDGQIGDGSGGWMILFVPLMALVTGWIVATAVRPRLSQWTRDWSDIGAALTDFGIFLGALFAVFGLAWALSSGLTALGFDPRGSFVDTYVQRNALVVGFVMGFAVIPIIYTISEDALSSVPEHLRSASLAAGATPWQTTVRIIIPTAMSGLFSAIMIGLGRAVGETMIVLMAAGNTPLMDMNIFNGFRTLSANIAVELPEAVRDSTHYRTLFLAALVLFLMTFVLNTFAEIVRQRFRKRSVQL